MQYRCIRDIRAIAACSVYEELTKMMSENPHLCATLRLYTSLPVYLRVCVYICIYMCTHTYLHGCHLIGSLGKYCSLSFCSEST